MTPTEASAVVADMEAVREAPLANYTIPHAIDDALWARRTPDGLLSPERSKQVIVALLAALEASPCFLKGAREGIPTFTLLAYDPAGHAAIRRWADLAQTHGARPEKYESALAMVRQWEQRHDLKWPT